MTAQTHRDNPELVLVVGLSGAGRTSVIKALEDLGFDTVDNLPASLLEAYAEDMQPGMRHAAGLDVRSAEISSGAVLRLLSEWRQGGHYRVTVLYLNASVETLLQRYSATRRSHPLSREGTPEAGIAREQALLSEMRDIADLVWDTSDWNVHQLRSQVVDHFDPPSVGAITLQLESFSFVQGIPPAAHLVFDCRFLDNPYWVAELRAQTGRDAEVQGYLRTDPNFPPFIERVLGLLEHLVPAYRKEGKPFLVIALGCTGGRHRSVATAETLAKALEDQGLRVSIKHRELQSQHQ